MSTGPDEEESADELQWGTSDEEDLKRVLMEDYIRNAGGQSSDAFSSPSSSSSSSFALVDSDSEELSGDGEEGESESGDEDLPAFVRSAMLGQLSSASSLCSDSDDDGSDGTYVRGDNVLEPACAAALVSSDALRPLAAQFPVGGLVRGGPSDGASRPGRQGGGAWHADEDGAGYSGGRGGAKSAATPKETLKGRRKKKGEAQPYGASGEGAYVRRRGQWVY